MATEAEAAIGRSGKLTRKGLLPWGGAETKIPEGVDLRGAVPLEVAARRGAGPLHVSIAGSTALRESARLGLAGCGVGRAIGPVEPSRKGMASE